MFLIPLTLKKIQCSEYAQRDIKLILFYVQKAYACCINIYDFISLAFVKGNLIIDERQIAQLARLNSRDLQVILKSYINTPM